MAYDGIVISSIISEIRKNCLGGRVVKVQQPSADIITLTMKGFSGQVKLYISANASLPIVYIADTLPQAPMQAPAFCMLLRKHLGNGRLTDIRQPGFDRIYDFVFEHLDEMGDLCERHLIVEIMGRQSNIILTDSEYMIMDTLRRVMPDLTEAVSSDSDKQVRILFPGQKYTYPDSQGKLNPVEAGEDEIKQVLIAKTIPVPKAIFTSITGFSKSSAEQIVEASRVNARAGLSELSESDQEKLFSTLFKVIDKIKAEQYSPYLKYIDGVPKDYYAIDINGAYTKELNGDPAKDEIEASEKTFSMSRLLVDFYSRKETEISVRSKSEDIRRVLKSAIERTSRKYDLQRNQLKETEDREQYRLYGELLNAYGYEVKQGVTEFTCLNYYDNQEITIPLDKDLTASENAQRYFAKYNKKKRTAEALTDFVQKTRIDLDYLLSAKHSLEIAETEADIAELRQEMTEAGFLKEKAKKKGARKQDAGKPLHFISSDGYDIYVGKNNIQNEALTFGLATGKDLWFHAKQMPGSHVIVKLKPEDNGLESVPDRVFEEAAALAAYYSSGYDQKSNTSGRPETNSLKIEIDYTERKNLKKPPQANPGYVIYHTNYSMMADPQEGSRLMQVQED